MPRSPDDTTLRRLLARIRDRSAVISVVGLGYVGLPLALRFAEAGFKVIGVDIDPRKISSLSVSKSYIGYIPDQEVARARDSGFLATTDFAALKDADAVIICVPTPLSRNREPDLSYVFSTLDSLVPFLSAGKVVSLESTTWPGTTEEEVLPRLSAGGLRVGQDFFLVFSPERADPANASHSTGSIPKICAGVTPSCLEAGTALYGSAIDTIVPMSSPRAAEMTKLLENIHRSVNIGLVNEMKIVSDRMGIDIFEVIRAAATKPFGFTPYFPGPGVGGHCIPVDPFYLTWKAREFGVHTRFIELAGEVNQGMPHWVVDKIASALNDRGKPLHGSRVLILGIAYKKNVEDMRESPSVEILSLLAAKGARVSYSDPHVPSFPEMRRHSFDLKSLELDPGVVAGFDCVVLATDHDGFDYDMIRESAALIVDTRGRFPVGDPRVVRA